MENSLLAEGKMKVRLKISVTPKGAAKTEKYLPTNIFLNDKDFSADQLGLVPVKILKGCYETYSTKIQPNDGNSWQYVILLPGTALKFPNQMNTKQTIKSLISILEIKNIPTKVFSISHRLNPIYTEALNDTLQMLEIIVKDKTIKSVLLLTWSGGCSHLREVTQMIEKYECQVRKIVLVSPVVDLFNKEREKCQDFLTQDFFQFVQKVYFCGDMNQIQKFSLAKSLQKEGEKHFLLQYPLSIIYGGKQFIKKDIEKFISEINQNKQALGMDWIDSKCFEGETHSLYCFVTTKETGVNPDAMKRIAAKKWHVSKYIADIIQHISEVDQERSDQAQQNPE